MPRRKPKAADRAAAGEVVFGHPVRRGAAAREKLQDAGVHGSKDGIRDNAWAEGSAPLVGYPRLRLLAAKEFRFAEKGGVGFHRLGAPDIVVAADDFFFAP